jgi:hypothetical protein
LTACIENGRTAPRLYKGNIRVVLRSPPSFLKQLHHMIFGFGTFFGMSGSHNDINVLQRSPLFARPTKRNTSPCYYTVNGHEYNMGYYLVDDIYPPCAIFVSTISNPVGQRKTYFAKRQEAARKDVERVFGVMHAFLQLFVDLLNNGI